MASLAFAALMQVVAGGDMRPEWAALSISPVSHVVAAVDACDAATGGRQVDPVKLTDLGWKLKREQPSLPSGTPSGASSKTFKSSDNSSEILLVAPMFSDSCIVLAKMSASGRRDIVSVLSTQGAEPMFKKSLRWRGKVVDIETISDPDPADQSSPIIVRALVAHLPEGPR
jgi:hypothetical protein